MVIDLNDEILQDFLLEAGEIVELLSEQLVELEKSPEDYDLLNAIFRGFHTIKGGAGFLAIDPLVGICHKAEDVFNCLRQGDRKVTQELMDVVLRALDVVNDIFAKVRAGQSPTPANEELLKSLQAFTTANDAEIETMAAVVQQPEMTVATKPVESITGAQNSASLPESDTITDEEFEAMLDSLHGKADSAVKAPAATVNQVAETITEAEFDDLLDQLQGKGAYSAPASGSSNNVKATPVQAQPAKLKEPESLKEETATNKNNKPAAANQAENTVRVDMQVLDNIMDMVGELVLVRNRFQTLKATADVSEQISQTMANLDVVTADLQLAVMKTRMQPIKKVFGRFPRVVRDLARSLNKEIRLDLVGEETELDKSLVEALADPLVHLVRNAVDHGVETPAEREAAGKPREGVIVLRATQAGDHIELSIKDDGKGMNADYLRAKVVEKGLMDEDAASRLDNKDCFNLIFMPGFSTKTEISDVSGRGVGMDVVKTRINEMNGTVEINSKEGKGSTILIKLPLTLAIMPTLMVKLGQQVFALPLASILEVLELDLNNINKVNGQLVVIVRQKALPLFYLSEWLINDPAYEKSKKRTGNVVVVNAGGHHVGFVVDQLIGQEEVVIKALGAKLQGLVGLSGATITGDGKIALILDVPGLMTKYVS